METRRNLTKAKWLLLAIVIVASFGTRLYRIGWSYWYDEIPTFSEINILFKEPLLSKEVPKDAWAGTAFVLTRVMPVGYALNGLTRHLVGKGEAKVRLGVAFSGAAAIILIFFLATRLYGVTLGMLLAGTLLVWPWHLFHSQSFRFYSYAHLFMSLALLTYATGAAEQKARWGIAAGVLSGLAIFSHTVCSFMVGLCIVFALKNLLTPRGRKLRAFRAYLFSVSPFVVAQLLVLATLLPRKPVGFSDTYTIAHNVTGFVFNLGWPVFLLYLTSWAWLIKEEKDDTDRLWAFLSCGLLLLAVGGPLAAPAFRPDYLFAMCLPVQLLASKSVQKVVHRISLRTRLFACVFGAGIVAMPLPSTVSYYLDGKRADYRAAGEYISRHIRDGDTVVSESHVLLEYYLRRPVAALRESQLPNLGASSRCWVVIEYGRRGIRPEIDGHLTGRARRVAHIRRHRLDYDEYTVDIFLLEPGNAPPASGVGAE